MVEGLTLVPTDIRGFDEIAGGGFPPGTCILLMVPPLIDVHLFCLEYIYKGISKGEPGLVITMDYSPEDLKIRALQYGWVLVRGEQQNILRWVDGYSMNARKDVESTDIIKRIGGSVALPDLTIGMSQAQQAFYPIKNYYRFIFDSLSTLFIYNDPNTIYRFLRTIIPKLRASGGIGFFLLGTGMHDPQIEMTLRYMMDGTIEVNNDLDMKILGLPNPTPIKNAHMSLMKDGFVISTK
jgi:KaiC/GvpD/RAD55 family RecA-like ATPase